MNRKVKATSIAAATLAALFLAGVNGHNEVKADTTINSAPTSQTTKVIPAVQSNKDDNVTNVNSQTTNKDKQTINTQVTSEANNKNTPVLAASVNNKSAATIKDIKENSRELTVKYDKDLQTNITWTPGLNNIDTVGKHLWNFSFYDNGEKFQPRKLETSSTIKNAEGKFYDGHGRKLNVGDTLIVQAYLDSGLRPNTWYKWKVSYLSEAANDTFNLDKVNKGIALVCGNDHDTFANILSRVYYDTENSYLYEQTDNDGTLPAIDDQLVYHWTQSPLVTYKIIAPSTTDTTQTSTNTTPSDVTNDPTSDISATTQTSIPTSTPSTKQDTSTEATKTNTEASNTTSNTKEDEVVTTKKKNLSLMLKHNAIVYNRKGKLVANRKIAGKYTYLTALDNGKIYTINHKKYYRVGKNAYVKVANTAKRNTRNVKYKATIINEDKTISLLNYVGRSKHTYLRNTKSLKLDRVRKVGRKTIYHIKGTKYWVNAKDIKLAK